MKHWIVGRRVCFWLESGCCVDSWVPVRTLYPHSLLSWLCLIREPIKPGPSPAQSVPVIPGVSIWCPVSLYWYRVIRSAQYQGLSGGNLVRECSQSEFSISEQWPIRGHVVWPECSVVMPPNYWPDIEECSIKERLPWGLTQTWHIHDTNISIRKTSASNQETSPQPPWY